MPSSRIILTARIVAATLKAPSTPARHAARCCSSTWISGGGIVVAIAVGFEIDDVGNSAVCCSASRSIGLRAEGLAVLSDGRSGCGVIAALPSERVEHDQNPTDRD